MSLFPDILGLKWPEAEEMLKSGKIRYQLIETAPPFNDKKSGEWRVVRQKISNDVLIVTVCKV